MRTIPVVFAAAMALAGCTSQQEQDLRAALMEKFKDDSDLKDYNLDPEKMADCVIGEITNGLPGFPGDPRRQAYLEAYARFATAKTASAAQEAIVKAKDVFASEQEAREAALGITDHILSCMGRFMGGAGEEDTDEAGPVEPESEPSAGTPEPASPTGQQTPPAAEPVVPPAEQ